MFHAVLLQGLSNKVHSSPDAVLSICTALGTAEVLLQLHSSAAGNNQMPLAVALGASRQSRLLPATQCNVLQGDAGTRLLQSTWGSRDDDPPVCHETLHVMPDHVQQANCNHATCATYTSATFLAILLTCRRCSSLCSLSCPEAFEVHTTWWHPHHMVSLAALMVSVIPVQ